MRPGSSIDLTKAEHDILTATLERRNLNITTKSVIITLDIQSTMYHLQYNRGLAIWHCG